MILGQFAGGPAVRTDYNQTDPNKADYLVGRENIAPMSHAEDKNNPHGVTIEQIGAAPSGYGLGGTVAAPNSDANALTANGWYRCHTNTPNDSWCYGQHIQHIEPGYAYQRFVSPTEGAIVERTKINGDWQPWQTVNPRMTLGVEYLTDEQVEGARVYTMFYSAGASAPSMTFTAPSGAKRIIRYTIWHGNYVLPIGNPNNTNYYAYTHISYYAPTTINYYADSRSDGYGNGGTNLRVQVWYTK